MFKLKDLLSFFRPIKANIEAKLLVISGLFTFLLGIITGLKKVLNLFPDDAQFSNVKNIEELFYINLLLFLSLCIWILFWKNPKEVFFDITEFHDFEDTKSRDVSFFDFISNHADLEVKFKRANRKVRSFIKYFKYIWFSWFCLYLFLFVFSLDGISSGASQVGHLQIKSILINLANNASTLFFIFCTLVLSKISSSEDETFRVKIDPKWMFLIAAPFILEIVAYGFINSNEIISSTSKGMEYSAIVSKAFGVLSGLMAMIAMSLLIGRLDSKLIDKLPNGVLIILYGYAGIQLYLPFYLEDVDGISIRLVAVMYLALFCKIVLLSFVYLIVKTNRLFFYFLAVYEIQNNIYHKWNEIKHAFVSKSTMSEEIDFSGKWEVYEFNFSPKDLGGLVTGLMKIKRKGTNYSGIIEQKYSVKSHNPDLEGKFYSVAQTIKAKPMLDGKIELKGSKAKVTDPSSLRADKYHPDNWTGIPVNKDTIIGSSIDEKGNVGHFCFKRMIKNKK